MQDGMSTNEGESSLADHISSSEELTPITQEDQDEGYKYIVIAGFKGRAIAKLLPNGTISVITYESGQRKVTIIEGTSTLQDWMEG